VRDAGSRAAGAVEGAYDDAREYTRGSLRRGQARLRACENSFEETVASRPLISLLIAAGIGAVAGVLWQRRR
jgi:ElaB/YqjD/DUF883 family membrane-anchored ribosome-binding protein